MPRRDEEDLNYLLHRQQVERTRAGSAPSDEARKAHEELALHYEQEIQRLTRGEIRFEHPRAE